MADTHTNDNTTCVVCFKNVQYFSIGECDHPVCFECSTRMRVLCLQNECPICRNVLGRVVFTDSILPYKELRNKVFTDRLFERQYKIGFCNEEIKKAYDTLLENRCSLCDNLPPFRVFSALSDHMRKVHEKYFCDLCVKHLKIFTSERRCYTRQELAHHRRKGDLDNTSHRGHPLCEFCEERFMDADELYRHLRKEHLYCHLCDADGKNLYYASHSALAHHFRTDHFLCEEGDCAGQHLTAVFRSEIDLKAHKATVHGRGMTRGAARQARTLELQFNITPHPVVTRAPRDRERERQSQLDESISPPTPAPAPRIDTGSDEHFPRLSAAPPAPGLLPGPPVKFRGAESLARTDKNFPALGLGDAGPSTRPARPAVAAATIVRNSKPSVSIQLHSQPASASNFRLTQTSSNRISVPQAKRSPLSEDDFPTLGNRDDHPSVGAGTIQPPKVTLINSQEMKAMKSNQTSSKPKKAPLSSEAFPALSTSSAPSAPPQWISVKKEKPKPKPEPAPIKTTPSFNPVADFPTLPNNKKNKKTPTPIPTSAPNRLSSGSTVNRSTTATKLNTPPDLKLSKKEKKKQFNLNLDNDSKKENIEVPQVNGLNDKRILQEMSYGESSMNAAAPVADRKIKTIDTIVKPEKERNGGNGDFALASKDFPTLSKGVPLSNKAPKDYSQISKGAVASKTKKAPNGAPPGFKPRPECNGMTFTNSSGQTFSAPVHTYIQPPDFEQRNRALVKKFVDALGSAEAVEEFKVASRAFRDNMIGADDFYKHCNEAMGSKLDDVFPDLVALLPDIAKQQELVVGRDVSLDVCATCGQLLAQSDRLQHESAHWPPLVPH